MDLLNLSILLVLAIAVIASLSLMVTSQKYLLRSTALLLGVVLLTYSTNGTALAALGASDRTLTPEQQQLEENLKLTPDGSHYSGIEYTESNMPPQGWVKDEAIKSSIESYAGDGVTVVVVNGAVRLSGRVSDQETARNIVDQTKAIPGVHEITFNLGLDNPTS